MFQKYEDPSKDNSPVQVMKLIYIKLRVLEKQGELSQGDLIQIDVNLNGLIASLGAVNVLKTHQFHFHTVSLLRNLSFYM